MKWIASFILLSLSLLGSVSITAPAGWDCIDDPRQLPKKIAVMYVGGNGSCFRPTLNVAKEPIEISLSDYMKAAKFYHEKMPQTSCRELGNVRTSSGEAEVLQIDRMTSLGEVRFLQAAVIVDHTAYVITGTCLKKDFGTYYSSFLDAIKSLSVENGKAMERVDVQP